MKFSARDFFKLSTNLSDTDDACLLEFAVTIIISSAKEEISFTFKERISSALLS